MEFINVNLRMEEYYQKFIDLQEKLRRSEEERMLLEIKFRDIVRNSKEEEQMHYRKLRTQYKQYLEEDQKRQARNEKIIRNLERIETKITLLSAKTERVNDLRRQYQQYLQRTLNNAKMIQNGHDQKTQNLDTTQLTKPIQFNHKEKFDLLDKYLENVAARKYATNTAADSPEFNANYANSVADDIMNSIYSRYYKRDEFRDIGHPRDDIHLANLEISRKDLPTTQKELRDEQVTSTDIIPNTTSLENDKGQNDKSIEPKTSQNINQESVLSDQNKLISCVNIDEKNGGMSSDINDKDIASTEPIPVRSIHMVSEKTVRFAENKDESNVLPRDIIEQLGNIDLSGKTHDCLDEAIKLSDPTTSDSSKEQINNIKKVQESNSTDHQGIYDNEIDQQYTEYNQDVQYDGQPYVYNENKQMEQNSGELSKEEYTANLQHSVNGHLNQVHYDDSGKLIQGQLDEKCQYNENGQLIQNQNDEIKQLIQGQLNEDLQYNADGQLTQCLYDENGQLIQNQYDQNGQMIQGQFDANAHYDEKGQSTQNQYDQDSQLIQGHYDENGTLIQSQFGENVQYDENGQLIENPYDQNSQLIQDHYDEKGQLIDHSGQLIQAQYDEGGKLIQGQFGETVQYDENGQLIQNQYDQNGQLTQDQYDENEQLIQNQYDQNGLFIQGQYDKNGKLIQGQIGENAQYDENGQLIQNQYDQNSEMVQEHYDESGQLIQNQYDENGKLNQSQYENAQYDENGQLIQSQFSENVQYDENRQLIQCQYDENGQLIQGQFNENLQYDENGQLMQAQYDENGKLIQGQYDENGQLIHRQYDESGRLIQNEGQLYQNYNQELAYDENGQLITQNYDDPNMYNHQMYDENGALLEHKFDGYTQPYPDQEAAEVTNINIADQQKLQDDGSSDYLKPNKGQPEMVKAIEDNVAKSPSNVLEMLDTDTESVKQNISINKSSNDSDFEFSNNG